MLVFLRLPILDFCCLGGASDALSLLGLSTLLDEVDYLNDLT